MVCDCGCPTWPKVKAILNSGRELYLCGHHAEANEKNPDVDCYRAA